MSQPSPSSILHLYRTTLRTSRSFSSYNFRQYFIRRTKSTFRDIQAADDSNKVKQMYEEAAKELAVLQRSAIVNRMYGGWKLVVEEQRPARERDVN